MAARATELRDALGKVLGRASLVWRFRIARGTVFEQAWGSPKFRYLSVADSAQDASALVGVGGRRARLSAPWELVPGARPGAIHRARQSSTNCV
jgi:hypothetical protein